MAALLSVVAVVMGGVTVGQLPSQCAPSIILPNGTQSYVYAPCNSSASIPICPNGLMCMSVVLTNTTCGVPSACTCSASGALSNCALGSNCSGLPGLCMMSTTTAPPMGNTTAPPMTNSTTAPPMTNSTTAPPMTNSTTTPATNSTTMQSTTAPNMTTLPSNMTTLPSNVSTTPPMNMTTATPSASCLTDYACAGVMEYYATSTCTGAVIPMSTANGTVQSINVGKCAQASTGQGYSLVQKSSTAVTVCFFATVSGCQAAMATTTCAAAPIPTCTVYPASGCAATNSSLGYASIVGCGGSSAGSSGSNMLIIYAAAAGGALVLLCILFFMCKCCICKRATTSKKHAKFENVAFDKKASKKFDSAHPTFQGFSSGGRKSSSNYALEPNDYDQGDTFA